MKEEEKDKLLKYLCMALPYGVKIQVEGLERDIIKDKGIRTLASVLPLRNAVEYDNHGANFGVNIEQVKPYLRPVSSMTDNESAELTNIISEWFDKELFYLVEEPFLEYALSKINYSINPWLFDWLLKKHFDFMGLIPIDLAIEVAENNNPYN